MSANPGLEEKILELFNLSWSLKLEGLTRKSCDKTVPRKKPQWNRSESFKLLTSGFSGKLYFLTVRYRILTDRQPTEWPVIREQYLILRQSTCGAKFSFLFELFPLASGLKIPNAVFENPFMISLIRVENATDLNAITNLNISYIFGDGEYDIS